MRRRPGRFGVAVRLVIVTVVATVVSFHSSPQARAQDGDTPLGLEVDGTGAYEVSPLMQAWGNPLFDSANPVNLSYIASGDADGRGQLALGQVDFAISGMPLTATDQQELAARNVTVVQAPLAMAAAVFVYEAPALGLEVCSPDPADPLGDPICGPYSGDLHLDNTLLASMWAGELSYNMFRDPLLVPDLDLPAGAQFQLPQGPQTPLARSDAGAANYFIEKYIQQYPAAAAFYNQHLTEDLLAGNIQSESWPFLDNATRAGPEATGDALESGNPPVAGNQVLGGVFGVLDQSTADKYVNEQTTARSGTALLSGAAGRLTTLALQNHLGEWVAPSPASITAAGALGNGAPLYGLNEDAEGAYPFTWVDSLYVPTTGLSVDKTNAIATFLRYATGPGQALAAGVGDGQLPPSLASQGPAKADEVVKGNCAAAGGTTKNDPSGGPDWPTGVPAPAGGALICVAPTVPVSTTVASGGSIGPSVDGSSGFGATAFSSSPSANGSSFDSSGGASFNSSSRSGSVGSTVSSDAAGAAGSVDSTSAPVTEAGPTTTSAPSYIAATNSRVDLPLTPPDDGEFALDRFTTIILGGLAFLVLRSFVRPRLSGAT